MWQQPCNMLPIFRQYSSNNADHSWSTIFSLPFSFSQHVCFIDPHTEIHPVRCQTRASQALKLPNVPLIKTITRSPSTLLPQRVWNKYVILFIDWCKLWIFLLMKDSLIFYFLVWQDIIPSGWKVLFPTPEAMRDFGYQSLFSLSLVLLLASE